MEKRFFLLLLAVALMPSLRCFAGETARIEEVTWETFSEGVRILIRMDRPAPVFCYDLGESAAVVIDPVGNAAWPGMQNIAVNSAQVTEIRPVTGAADGQLDFIVVTLETPLAYNFARDGSTHIVEILKAVPLPDKPAPVEAIREEQVIAAKIEAPSVPAAPAVAAPAPEARPDEERIKEARYYRDRGLEQQRAGSLDNALEYYRAALGLYPEFVTARNDIAVVLVKQGKLDEAEKELKKLLDITPDYIQAHTNLAYIYEQNGNNELALRHWKIRYELGDPRDAWTREAMRRIERLGGRVE